jgi:type II secretion system protein D
MARDNQPTQKRAPDSADAKPPPPPSTDTNAASGGTNAPPAKEKKKSPDDLIQLTFQGANIDMIVQWLAETTDKSVVKHPQVQCQITIVGSKKVTRREAVTLVYRALALEGFTAIESAKSILIVPEGKEPKLSPELIEGPQTGVPGSRERLVKVFSLQHAHAALLKDKIKPVLSEKATIEVDEQANALIITDYNDNVAVAGQLINALDTDKPQDIMVRVIPLKNANAQDLAKELEPFYPKSSGKGDSKEAKETLEISANARSNSLLIFSGESDFKAIEELVATLDTEDAQEKVMRSFLLKNADAADVARQLQDLYKESESTGNRYPFFFSSSDSNNNNTKKLSVVSDRRRNAIIVQAAPPRMEAIVKMVEALDEPLNDDSLAPKIYVLKYVSASDIEDVLNELFLKKTQQQRPYWWDDEPAAATPDRDVGRLYGKVRITSEPYSNAIIITSNSGENLAAVEEVLRQLDVPSQAGETTFRIGLRFADAAIMANSINVLFAKGGSPPLRPPVNNNQNQNGQQQQGQQGQQTQNPSENNFEITEQTKEESYYPWLGGQPDNPRNNDTRAQRPVSDLIGRIRAVADARSNSLLVSANVHFFPQVMKLIEEMDVPTAEVMIEARIVEVSSDFLDQLGVRWSPNGTASFTGNDNDNGIVASSSGQYQTGFAGKSAVNNPPTTSAIASALTSLRTGFVNNTLDIDFLIQFLHEHTDAIVLADPHLEIGDNEHGRLFVGQRVPVPTGSVNPALGGSSTSIAYQDAGVTLEVEPHINDSGDVTLRILTESSSVSSVLGLAGSPIFNTANFHTELIATNGQTLILGGIIQKQSTLTLRKTPLLGSIPGLKWVFNKKDNSDQRTELLVFLRPKVTRTPQEARLLLEEINKKTPLIQNWSQTEAAKKDLTPKTPPAKP